MKWINIRTKEIKEFSQTHGEGLPVGGPEDAEGNPLWVPYHLVHQPLGKSAGWQLFCMNKFNILNNARTLPADDMTGWRSHAD